MLFDTHDKPKLKHNFNETLKVTKFAEVFTGESIEEMAKIYPAYLEKVALGYIQAGKIKEFPYPLNVRQSPLFEFENQQDLVLNAESPLSKISFFMEYSV